MIQLQHKTLFAVIGKESKYTLHEQTERCECLHQELRELLQRLNEVKHAGTALVCAVTRKPLWLYD